MNEPKNALLVHGITAAELIEQLAAAVVAALTPVIETTRDRGLLSRDELADFLSVSGSHVDTLTRAGEIPCIRLGRSVRYDADAVLATLREGADQ